MAVIYVHAPLFRHCRLIANLPAVVCRCSRNALIERSRRRRRLFISKYEFFKANQGFMGREIGQINQRNDLFIARYEVLAKSPLNKHSQPPTGRNCDENLLRSWLSFAVTANKR